MIVRDLPSVLALLARLPSPSVPTQSLHISVGNALGSVYNAARFADAARLGRLCLILCPGDGGVLGIAGFACNRIGEPAAAARLLTRALATGPSLGGSGPQADRIHLILGIIRTGLFHDAADKYHAGDFDGAEALLHGLLEVSPADPLAHALLGTIGETRRGTASRPDDALSAMNRARAADPRPVWAVVIGILRNEEEFRAIVRWLSRLRELGVLDGIVLSTWTGQLSGRPALAAEVAALGIRVVEAEEPRVRMKWNTLQQMVALQNGIDLCPAGSYVLKARTDQIYSRQYERFIYDCLSGRAGPLMASDGPLLEKRIAVCDGFFPVPFYFNDLAFFGLKSDIERLLNFDLRYVFCYRSMISEQWFFSRPFVAGFPIFDTYFRVQRGHAGTHRLTMEWFGRLLEQPFFLDVFVSYLTVVQRYFRVGPFGRFDPINRAAAAALRGIPAARLLSDPAFVGYRGNFASGYWIEPLLRGELAPDELGRRIRDAAERVAAPEFQAGYGGPEAVERPEVREFARLFDRLVEEAGGSGEIWSTSMEPLQFQDFWRSL